jgi:hypothetical protein
MEQGRYCLNGEAGIETSATVTISPGVAQVTTTMLVAQVAVLDVARPPTRATHKEI